MFGKYERNFRSWKKVFKIVSINILVMTLALPTMLLIVKYILKSEVTNTAIASVIGISLGSMIFELLEKYFKPLSFKDIDEDDNIEVEILHEIMNSEKPELRVKVKRLPKDIICDIDPEIRSDRYYFVGNTFGSIRCIYKTFDLRKVEEDEYEYLLEKAKESKYKYEQMIEALRKGLNG